MVQLMHVAIGGRGWLSHITAVPPTPSNQITLSGTKRCHGHFMDN